MTKQQEDYLDLNTELNKQINSWIHFFIYNFVNIPKNKIIHKCDFWKNVIALPYMYKN